ncbi:hypothetical protein G7054_g10369 [Neopestalotiopsis clavispora]|nr:hypothetical protein G7054_g10369 [Neopestalotiopsis clavispora]
MADFKSRDVPYGLRQVLNDEKERNIFRNLADSEADNNMIFRYIPRELDFDSQRSVLKAPDTHALNHRILLSCRSVDPNLEEKDYTWNAVLDTIEAAKAAYHLKGENDPLRRFLRNGDPAASLLIAACEMIPDDNGLSAIRAGLVTIFKVRSSRAFDLQLRETEYAINVDVKTWQKRIANVEKILSAFGDLPRIFSEAVELWRCFRDNEQLKIAVHDLGQSILDGIDTLICILQKESKDHNGSRGRSINPRRLIQMIPQKEETEIDQVLSSVEAAKQRFSHRVNVLDQQRSANIERKAGQTLQTSQANREAIFQNRQAIRETGDHIGSRIDVLEASVQELITRAKEKEEDLAKGSARIPESIVGFSNMTIQLLFENAYKEREYKNSMELFAKPKRSFADCQPTHFARRHPALQYPLMSVATLMEVMNAPHLSPTAERDAVLKKSRTFKEDTLARGRWLLTMESFKNFVSPSSSGLLLVDGYCGDFCAGKVSPLSVICATLAATLDQTQSHVVLHFFCGQHCRSKDAISGPMGLMRSLIYQMIIYPGILSPKLAWESSVTREQLASGDLSGLCSIFKELINFVDPQLTIYCILDGISDFEILLHGWIDQLKQLFEILRGLITDATDGRTGPYFKLLMTSAEKSTHISRLIDPSDRIALRAGNMSSPGRAQRALNRFAGDT